jgi:hypothetical protein
MCNTIIKLCVEKRGRVEECSVAPLRDKRVKTSMLLRLPAQRFQINSTYVLSSSEFWNSRGYCFLSTGGSGAKSPLFSGLIDGTFGGRTHFILRSDLKA